MPTQPANLESNIWKYTVSLVTNKRVFVAILGAYYLTIPDVTVQTIGLLALIGNVSGFLFEIPSGYVSDKMGHKQALVLAHVAMVLSTAFFLWAGNVLFLALGSVFLSISNAFRSGTGAAFMHETLRGLGREDEYAKIVGKMSSIGFAVPIALTTALPFLVGISYTLPFAIALVVDVIGLCVALTLVVPRVPQEHIEEIRATNFRQVMQEGARLGYFKYVIFGAIISGTLFAVGFFRAPYQVLLDLPIIWFGVLFGAGRVLASTLLFYSGTIKKWFKDIHAFNRFRITLYTLLIFALGMNVNPWCIAGIFLVINGFQWGLAQVSSGFIMEIIRESKFKATLLSVRSQAGNISAAVVSYGIGVAVSRTSYADAFFTLAICFLVTTVLMYWYIVRKES